MLIETRRARFDRASLLSNDEAIVFLLPIVVLLFNEKGIVVVVVCAFIEEE
jgi:Na+/H+ antiporter NhaD/arsenite permease-like protein